jgi:hypothetical protein
VRPGAEAMTPEQFACALVERLGPVLPAGFAARAEGDTIAIDAPDGIGAATSLSGLLDRDTLDAEDYASAAWMVLSMAQDVVCETTTDPWPAAPGASTDLAEPGTRVEGRQLALYFGPEAQPVLTLGPIDLGVLGA